MASQFSWTYMTLILQYKSSFYVHIVEKAVRTWFNVGQGKGNHNMFTLFLLSLKRIWKF